MESENCPECNKELVKLDWNSQTFLLICDNWKCSKFHSPQDTIAKEKRKEQQWKPLTAI